MSWIENSLQKLLKKNDWLTVRIEEICSKISIEDTASKSYCYCIKSNSSWNPRVEDLADFVWDRILDYAIPKKEFDEAKEELEKTWSSAKFIELQRKAKSLFTDIKNTGEGGEMLLYILIQEFLGYPQLLSKMSLKTSWAVHYHWVDWIHVNYNKEGILELYWGESKMYADINDAMDQCFKSLKDFLIEPDGSGAKRERDLQLINTNIANELNDSKLEDLLVRYLDRDDELSNSLVYKWVCFIWFDYGKYPTPENAKKLEELKKEIEAEFSIWRKKLSEKIKGHPRLELYEMHVFLIPFPSVQKFRDYFLKYID